MDHALRSSSRTAGLLPEAGRALLPAADRGATPVVLADRPDGTVLRLGGSVLKAHAPGTDRRALELRLRAAAGPQPVLLAPHRAEDTGRMLLEVDGMLVTAWPAGEPVDPQAPQRAPWEQAGALAARLHATPALPGLPPMGGPAKVAAALRRLSDLARATGGVPGADRVRVAAATLPPWARGVAPAPERGRGGLVHGDLHLGQLVRLPSAAADDPYAGWRLIDVDDLGVGDPAWDLARPAAWYAAGLLPLEPWQAFLGAYRAAGGRALPQDAGADPWTVLDVPARALVVQLAALGLVRAAREGRPPDEVEQLMVAACARIGGAGQDGR
ncbi:phosphotransferase family protein [Streptacidiphilus griseoplanus]|uniref:phosphotransferase family protein n=1 Tax=Peterkaempfera griseoplana TaxID=66896 RepID=UPI0006E31DC1|nr:phosphotransferase [Peterkaempfera griseoplana]